MSEYEDGPKPIPDISGIFKLGEWTPDADVERALPLATRSALRALPAITFNCDHPNEQYVVCVLRGLLHASVASHFLGNELERFTGIQSQREREIIGLARESEFREPFAGSHLVYATCELEMITAQPSNVVGSVEDSAKALEIILELPKNDHRSDGIVAFTELQDDLIHLFHAGIGAGFERALWAKQPKKWDDALDGLGEFFSSSKVKWSYWQRWYEGMLNGEPLPWDLQRDIALIDNEIWEAGPDAIAEEIARIEEEFYGRDPLDEADTKAQVQKLLASHLKSGVEARGLSSLISMALNAYRREISNALPDELEPLEQLPSILDHIALILAGDTPATEQEAQLYSLIQDMARTINALNRRLGRANAATKAAEAKIKDQAARKLFADAFYTNAGAGFGKLISSPLLWGPVIAGGAIFLGAGSEAATDKLAWLCSEVVFPENPDAIRSPAPTNIEGAKFVKPPE